MLLVLDRDNWWAVVNTIMNLGIFPRFYAGGIPKLTDQL
jgi:hypothetical protein